MKNNMKSELTKELPYNGLVYLLSVLNNPKGTSFSEGVLQRFTLFSYTFCYRFLL